MPLFATSLSKLTISLTNYVRWHLLVLAPEDELERNMRTGLLRRTLGLTHYCVTPNEPIKHKIIERYY